MWLPHRRTMTRGERVWFLVCTGAFLALLIVNRVAPTYGPEVALGLVGVMVLYHALGIVWLWRRGHLPGDAPPDVTKCRRCGYDLWNLSEPRCPECGALVSGDVDTCPECGESFEEEDFRCPECGAQIEKDASSCDECGTEFEGEEDEDEDEEEGEEGEEEDYEVEIEDEE